MVRSLAVRGAFLALALVAATRTCRADKITYTGNVESDMPTSNKNVVLIPGNAIDTTAQAAWMTAEGKVNGWVMKDIRLSYDAASDTLQVGVNFWGVAGDADGDGDPSRTDPRTSKVMGVDAPNLSGHESISVAFAADSTTSPGVAGTPIIVAGVPYDKTKAGPGLDGFTVSSYTGQSGISIAYNYKDNLPDHQGTLAFNPDAAHPDFEFSIKNFSKIPGLDPNKGVWVKAYAGTPDDIVTGDSFINGYRVSKLVPQTIPEPGTVLAWTVVAGGLAWRGRKRLRLAASY